ncbi:thiopeptide-type bacteriocin biosynthesis protein [Modestobacter sp. VKM Ac-2977]|uniref:thiopeptide-type bacteriocin biosynthesis protein n=1 Tax=Modestobacter sp. VKM Ac-2977 TaxID=3004131 RepID=UPI0022AB42C1|nr:thiopeptide-type bacteriocin biosynthesis protein [Modestobacter sp. VKM Ac-2977]MCZ2819834.1 thiopeptide-type bacteriocin biosynthesis protein [Modestobacter sp. VKM Ac-2977]
MTLTTDLAAQDDRAAEPRVDPGWVALHVYYSSNSNPLLEEMVKPLVDRLRSQGLIDGWFFIRYWMEGPHIRLRLHPRDPADRELVLALAGEAVGAYMRHRPALYRLDPQVLGPLYKDMFLMEYTEEDWTRTYGENGTMPMQDTNTWDLRDYEPEYVKYGGPRGVRIAEGHFERSSDLVLELVASTNMHVRNIVFGLAVQVMTVTTAVFLGERAEMASFLRMYQRVWEGTFLPQDSATRDGFESNYLAMAPALAERLGTLQAAVAGEDASRLSGFLRPWYEHCTDLRAQVADACARGELVFPTDYGRGDRVTSRDLPTCLRSLLVPFLHMTNNRLGVSIVDEVYLAHLLARTMDAAEQ